MIIRKEEDSNRQPTQGFGGSINQGSRCEGSAPGQVGEEAVQRRGRLLGESSRGYSAVVLRNQAQ